MSYLLESWAYDCSTMFYNPITSGNSTKLREAHPPQSKRATSRDVDNSNKVHILYDYIIITR